MQYLKLTTGDTTIEFHNNWLGEETVIVQGQIVSKKSSITGTHHPFSLIEDGEKVNYVLTTKLDMNLQVLIDLRRNGKVVHENVIVAYGTMPRKPKNKAKKRGIVKLQEYDIKGALEELKNALNVDAEDPEIYFHMACAYSIQEKPRESFENLKKAVENKLQDTESILNHDMLAYTRMHPAFEGFLNSNFSDYEIS